LPLRFTATLFNRSRSVLARLSAKLNSRWENWRQARCLARRHPGGVKPYHEFFCANRRLAPRCTMFRIRFVAGIFATFLLFSAPAQELLISDANPLAMPPVGAHQLRILSPTLLELTLITTEKPGGVPAQWNFVGAKDKPNLPGATEFAVIVGGKNDSVQSVGFKRRVIYAPLKHRDLRIGNHLYLQVATPIAENQSVEVRNPSRKLWPAATHFAAKADPLRWSPAIHVNQVGYLPDQSKKAMVGFYLGSLGEMNVSTASTTAPNFTILDAASGKEMFNGK